MITICRSAQKTTTHKKGMTPVINIGTYYNYPVILRVTIDPVIRVASDVSHDEDLHSDAARIPEVWSPPGLEGI